MKNKIIMKGLVICIICLCVLLPIYPANAVIINKSTTTQTSVTGNANVLCEIRVVWRQFRLRPTINVIPGNKSFNFTEIGGFVKGSFTIICKTWSDPAIIFPRWSIFEPGLYITLSRPERVGRYAFFYQKGTEEFSITWNDMLMETNGENLSRIVWPAGGGMLYKDYPEDAWNITIHPI